MSAVLSSHHETESERLGGGIWEHYKSVVTEEGDLFGDISATSMNGVMTFAGLLAATLAALLAETYKSLSPDPDGLEDDASSTFVAPHSAIVVNTLWTVALLVSLSCALLATLVQEWARGFMRAQAHPKAVEIEQQYLERLSVHMGVQRYGLGRIPTLVVGLLHAAVALFMAGIDVFLWDLHPTLAHVALGVTVGITLCYAFASCMPLFDTSCPYHTPLTDLLVVAVMIIVVAVPGTLVYCFLLLALAWYKVFQGPLNAGMRRVLNPAALISQLWCDPFTASRTWRALKEYHTRRKTAESITFAPHVIRAIMGDPEDTVAAMSAQKFKFIWSRVGNYAMEHPVALQYVVGTFIGSWSPELDSLFVGIRYNETQMSMIGVALGCVNSVFAAAAMLRLLQLVLQAENADDRGLRAMVGEDARWRMTAEIVRAFPTFAEHLAELRRQELQQYDTNLLATLSSFRTTLIRLLALTSTKDAEARACILGMFAELQRFDSVMLHHVSADDTETIGRLYESSRDPIVELATRNALTLIVGAKESYWRGTWPDPDRRYLRRTALGTLRWHEFFPEAAQRRVLHKPAASSFFRKLLEEIHLDDWLAPGSAFGTPRGTALTSTAIVALRDLANTVTFGLQSEFQSRIVNDVQSTVTSAMTYEAPGSPSLGKAEKGEVRLSRGRKLANNNHPTSTSSTSSSVHPRTVHDGYHNLIVLAAVLPRITSSRFFKLYQIGEEITRRSAYRFRFYYSHNAVKFST
ncbi:unnamed protein product [Peniophora sp. CBMAI 1063]|nr:unnamed protein product [Peniophora sp. CBMAI 1063]